MGALRNSRSFLNKRNLRPAGEIMRNANLTQSFFLSLGLLHCLSLQVSHCGTPRGRGCPGGSLGDERDPGISLLLRKGLWSRGQAKCWNRKDLSVVPSDFRSVCKRNTLPGAGDLPKHCPSRRLPPSTPHSNMLHTDTRTPLSDTSSHRHTTHMCTSLHTHILRHRQHTHMQTYTNIHAYTHSTNTHRHTHSTHSRTVPVCFPAARVLT